MNKLNLRGVPTGVWIRVIAMLIAWVNLVVTSFTGFELLPFADEQIYEGVSYAVTIIVTIWTGWKNNGFTKIAQVKDEEIRRIKKAG